MKKMKNRKGFTLVELIVVIAILAILAGIAIPVYSNYIDKARQASDMQVLDSVRTAATFAAVEKNPDAKVTEIEFTAKNTFTVTCDPSTTTVAQADVEVYCGAISLEYIGTCTWTPAGGWANIVKQS